VMSQRLNPTIGPKHLIRLPDLTFWSDFGHKSVKKVRPTHFSVCPSIKIVGVVFFIFMLYTYSNILMFLWYLDWCFFQNIFLKNKKVGAHIEERF
jgi:hypothetical protein